MSIKYDIQEEYCRSARCTACAPALLAGSAVCRDLQGGVTRRCLLDTLGDTAYCGGCVPDYAAY